MYNPGLIPFKKALRAIEDIHSQAPSYEAQEIIHSLRRTLPAKEPPNEFVNSMVTLGACLAVPLAIGLWAALEESKEGKNR